MNILMKIFVFLLGLGFARAATQCTATTNPAHVDSYDSFGELYCPADVGFISGVAGGCMCHCNNGYTAFPLCSGLAPVCTCDNGNAATGAACYHDGAKCASCDTGYGLKQLKTTGTCGTRTTTTPSECENAREALWASGVEVGVSVISINELNNAPPGCFMHGSKVYFNTHLVSSLACSANFECVCMPQCEACNPGWGGDYCQRQNLNGPPSTEPSTPLNGDVRLGGTTGGHSFASDTPLVYWDGAQAVNSLYDVSADDFEYDVNATAGWYPICGHAFWDAVGGERYGADIICKKAGYVSGHFVDASGAETQTPNADGVKYAYPTDSMVVGMCDSTDADDNSLTHCDGHDAGLHAGGEQPFQHVFGQVRWEYSPWYNLRCSANDEVGIRVQCESYTCTCDNGSPARASTTPACTSDGAKCASCDTGYFLSDGACAAPTSEALLSALDCAQEPDAYVLPELANRLAAQTCGT